MKKIAAFFITCFTCMVLLAQHNYVAPKDSLVIRKLEQWQGKKFGLFMHWGTYSQWGVVESWSICPEDEGWTVRRGPFAQNYNDYKKAYENLATTFNPIKFNPAKWAGAASEAGMQYVVFTTKHHDGFCMFDTKQTDYKISNTPFASNPKSNVALEIFNAFRQKGFMTGAYFSKPDWHDENYWWPYFPPKDRNVNYDPVKYPERWNAFKDFTKKQIDELMTSYGKMDILWLDGGWVRPKSTIDTSIVWQRTIPYDQDIDMATIAANARKKQPGLIVVDRSVTGEYENYTTPEQEVPEKPLPYPWETCMTMGSSWSYVPNDKYKSTHTLVQLLVKIVSRGGNLLLNIGPGPDGDFAPEAYARLKEIGQWIKVNGEGIYNTKPVSPYSSGNWFFTQSVSGKSVYAFYLPDTDSIKLLTSISIPGLSVLPQKKITLLGTSKKLEWENKNGSLLIHLPGKAPSFYQHAVGFKIE